MANCNLYTTHTYVLRPLWYSVIDSTSWHTAILWNIVNINITEQKHSWKRLLTVVHHPCKLLPVRVLQQVWRWTTSLCYSHTHPHTHTWIYLPQPELAIYVVLIQGVSHQEKTRQLPRARFGSGYNSLFSPACTHPLPPPCAIGGTLLHCGHARTMQRCNSITISILGSWPSSFISLDLMICT